MATGTAEDAVRRYVTALRDPEALVDKDEIDRLQTELNQTGDPVAMLRIRQRLHELHTATPQTYEGDFVEHARAWAEANGVGAEAFRAEGVSDEVLERAGLRPNGHGEGAGSRRSRVSADAVRRAVPPRARFTLHDIRRKTGASTATIRKTLTTMVAEGAITDLGPAENHRGPGRAPRVYQRGR